MSRTDAQWASWLERHLPRGVYWSQVDPRVGRLLAGLGAVLQPVGVAVDALRAGTAPTGSTGDPLSWWEEALRLPDTDRPLPITEAGRQAEVGRAMAQGGRPTPAYYVAQAAIWGEIASVWEPESWPWHVWLLGPVEHVKAARSGMAKSGDLSLYLSDLWRSVLRLCDRNRPARIVLHTRDAD